MKVLHITADNNGYEIVELIKNKISEKNNLALIKKEGKEYMTGGFIIKNTPQIKNILDTIPKEKQYQFIKDIKLTP